MQVKMRNILTCCFVFIPCGMKALSIIGFFMAVFNFFIKLKIALISFEVRSLNFETHCLGAIKVWLIVIGIFVGNAQANLFSAIFLFLISGSSQNAHLINFV